MLLCFEIQRGDMWLSVLQLPKANLPTALSRSAEAMPVRLLAEHCNVDVNRTGREGFSNDMGPSLLRK
jgi:hypothetical protein